MQLILLSSCVKRLFLKKKVTSNCNKINLSGKTVCVTGKAQNTTRATLNVTLAKIGTKLVDNPLKADYFVNFEPDAFTAKSAQYYDSSGPKAEELTPEEFMSSIHHTYTYKKAG